MHELTLRHAPLLLAALVLVGGCGELCTEVGCEYPGTLGVRFDRALTTEDSFDLVIQAPGVPTSRWRCENRSCSVVDGMNAGYYASGQGIRANLSSAQPETVEITIESDGRSTVTEHVLDYEASYPNGESCGPRCDVAMIDVLLPR